MEEESHFVENGVLDPTYSSFKSFVTKALETGKISNILGLNTVETF